MKIPDGSKFSPWKYVEIANYVPQIGAVIRYQRKISEDERQPILMAWGKEVNKFREKHSNTGVYTTVFRYSDNDASSDFSQKLKLGSLYFDLDSEEDVRQSFRDASRLCDYLRSHVPSDYIRLYFTGSKGFHVEVEALALGVSPGLDLHQVFRSIAESLRDELDLTTLDFSVYDPRRMWRLPYSKHQKTGLYKIDLPMKIFTRSTEDILHFARKPIGIKKPDPKFNVDANQWYKAMISDHEVRLEREREERAQRRLELFNKYGTSIARKGHTASYVKKTWASVMKKLRAEINERNTMLSRQSFRIFLMYLEADMDLEEASQILYDVAIEIGLEERETVATIKSAKRAAQDKHAKDPTGYLGV